MFFFHFPIVLVEIDEMVQCYLLLCTATFSPLPKKGLTYKYLGFKQLRTLTVYDGGTDLDAGIIHTPKTRKLEAYYLSLIEFLFFQLENVLTVSDLNKNQKLKNTFHTRQREAQFKSKPNHQSTSDVAVSV